jgi:hypothetical protein
VATSDSVELLGIFEDRPQADFVGTLIQVIASRGGYQAVVEPRLTEGCRVDNLNDQLRLAEFFDGVIVGVDGRQLRPERKVTQLAARCVSVPKPVLWSIACPCVEEWMMADPDALPAALQQRFGSGNVHRAKRPPRPRSERTAKRRLGQWIEGLLGAPALSGGVEYAADTARHLSPTRVSAGRHPDLIDVLNRLPGFLRSCLRSRRE